MNFSIQSVYNWYRSTLRNPKYRWWLILATAAYLVSPIDLLPDFIPLAGQLDDLAIASLLVAEVSQLVLDGLKNRRGTTTAAATPADINPQAAKSVDVEAVSVE